MRARAAVLHSCNQPLSIEDVDLAEPLEGEVLLRVGATGICHSDVYILDGSAPYPLPMIPGHEAAGVVVDIGARVDGITVGDHVVLSFRPQCGRCNACTRGWPVLCEGHSAPYYTMLDGTARATWKGKDLAVASRLGTFAEYVVAPAEQVIPVRPDVPMDVLSLVSCAVTTGICAVTESARVHPGSSIAVFGCGGVGLNVIIGAVLAGAAQIIAVDTVEDKLVTALEFGATDTVNVTTSGDPADLAARSRQVIDTILDLSDGGVDYAFEAVGRSSTVEMAIEVLRARGMAIVIGLALGGQRASFNPLTLLNKEKTIRGSWYGSARPRIDFPRIVDLFARGRIPLDRLITRRYPLEQINQAFEDLLAGRVARGVVVFDDSSSSVA